MRSALIGIVLATTVIACRQSVEPPTGLTVSLQANTTVAVRGDTVTFTVIAAGNNLFGVVMEYGDEATDRYATGGALSARVTFKHAYSDSGTFTARAVVSDAVAGDKDVTISIVVN
jgi:hypothetical protein